MKKRDKMTLASLTLVVIVCSVLVGNLTSVDVVGYEPYVVGQGETLWSISKQIVGERVDVRKVVHEIQKKNNITPMLQVGQEIQVPIYE